MENKPPLLDIRDVEVLFQKGKQKIYAVHGVTLAIEAGMTLGIVGESGSGKSTLARAILRLTPISKGTICFDGLNLLETSKREQRKLKRQMQLVFQDPGGSLN